MMFERLSVHSPVTVEVLSWTPGLGHLLYYVSDLMPVYSPVTTGVLSWTPGLGHLLGHLLYNVSDLTRKAAEERQTMFARLSGE